MADIYKCDVHTLKQEEGPAYGAAILAGVGTGIYSSIQEACDAFIEEDGITECDLKEAEEYEKFHKIYDRFYEDIKEKSTRSLRALEKNYIKLFKIRRNFTMKRRLVTKTYDGSRRSSNGSNNNSGKCFAAEDGGQTYGVTYWCESDFFKTVADSITEEAEADGNKTVVVDAQQDSAKQIQIIEDFIAQGVSAVFLNPVDKDAIEPALQKLDEAGIPVVNFDTSVSNLDLVGSYVATDNYQAGVLCAKAMIEDFPDGGEIAVLDYPANNACNDREQGFLDTIEGKGFDVVATLMQREL